MEKKHMHNTEIVNALAEKYSFSPRYIRMILDNDRTPIFQDRIIAEYRRLYNDMQTLLRNNKDLG